MKNLVKKIIILASVFLIVFINMSYADDISFSQPEFHPSQDDLFGISIDAMPIKSVKVNDSDDIVNNKIALTFDSAYINLYTYRILDILDEYDAKATFFMTYKFMNENPDQVKEIIKRGHEIGNHSTTHPKFTEITDEKIVREVAKCHNFLKELTGVDMCLFRFPYGVYSDHAVSILKSLGYYPIQWSFDSFDWRNESIDILLNRIFKSKNIYPGGICLFHNGATYTPDALPLVLQYFKNKGLVPCRVTDLIYKHNFYLENGVQVSR